MAFALANSGWIDSLKNNLYDAQSNLYYITIDTPASATTLTEDLKDNTAVSHLSVRCKGFTPPTYEQKVNSVKYLTTGVDLPMAAFQTSNKEFKITFRLDAYYDVYRYLMNLQKLTSMPSIGATAISIPKGITVKVYAYTSSSAGHDSDQYANIKDKEKVGDTDPFSELFTFSDCWIKNISGLSYNYQNAAPMEVTATFGFIDYTAPGNTMIEVSFTGTQTDPETGSGSGDEPEDEPEDENNPEA